MPYENCTEVGVSRPEIRVYERESNRPHRLHAWQVGRTQVRFEAVSG